MTSRGGCFMGASLSCADILVHLYGRVLHVPDSGRPRPRLLLPVQGTRRPGALRGARRGGSSRSEAAHAAPLDRRRHLLAPEPRGARRRVPLRLARPPSVGGPGRRPRHPFAGGVEPRLRAARRRRAERGLGLGGLPRGGRPPRGQPRGDRGPKRVPGQRRAPRISFPSSPWPASSRPSAGAPSRPTATTSIPSTRRCATCLGGPAVRRWWWPGPCGGRASPSLEARADRWFARFSPAEVDALLRELHGEAAAELVTEGVVVR